jgi:peptide/nickel transport system substrate-binding protein
MVDVRCPGLAAAGRAGTRVPITLLILNTTMNVQGAQVIQAMAREAGFDIKIDSRETGTAEDRYFNGDFEMFWGSWSGRVDPDGNIANWLMCQGGPISAPPNTAIRRSTNIWQ